MLFSMLLYIQDFEYVYPSIAFNFYFIFEYHKYTPHKANYNFKVNISERTLLKIIKYILFLIDYKSLNEIFYLLNIHIYIVIYTYI